MVSHISRTNQRDVGIQGRTDEKDLCYGFTFQPLPTKTDALSLGNGEKQLLGVGDAFSIDTERSVLEDPTASRRIFRLPHLCELLINQLADRMQEKFVTLLDARRMTPSLFIRS